MTSGLDRKLGDVLGGRTAAAYAKAFGMATVGDLLSHYPRRYAKRGELTSLAELPLDENVTIVAEVRKVSERRMQARKGSILEVLISDGQGLLTLTFFNQSWRAQQLKPGVRGIFAGKVGRYRSTLQLAHPDYELFPPEDETELAGPSAKAWADEPVPIYPATSSIASWQIGKSVALALESLDPIEDPVPDRIRERFGVIHFGAALELIHRPRRDADWRSARDALRLQEAFVLQAALLEQRMAARAVAATARTPVAGGFLERFDAGLTFELTGDQRRVGAEIAADLAEPVPMNRLVQGEVGSGKTLVALRGMLQVADSGGQSALLAPTEVLAAQHLRSIVRSLGPDLAAELMPTLLTGQLSASQRRRALLRVVSGQARIVVGTHALLGDDVGFFDLGLVVVDEQHRFGVEQREALRAKGGTPPHVLVLTATPIPRTVAMTVFGDLDVSTIAELPAGRAGIESHVVPLADHPGWTNRVWQRAAEEIEKGRQVFVVCPAIDAKHPAEDDGEDAEAEGDAPAGPRASVESTMQLLAGVEALAGRRIAALHGRMSAEEKDAVMQDFAAGRVSVLVSTTVIEVGVDVPNASMMIVLDADRFGVSQLHQLRGRVGRGGLPGLCLFVTNAEQGSVARERVDAVAATLDGFELAQIDLELRREGDVLGATQSGGRSSLRLLRVVADAELIAEARAAAEELLDEDPVLAGHPALREAIARRLDESAREFLAKN
ncbi:ATP-dependent DNA helicase RecG [Naasia sp. SYSU D00948]|uniref:ATP-dependent DNA helicase RecG n=1 Tax=Naasia sp. SYSU D00948 TaxID=2817379 RepID=UPI001B30A70D|nr:ATP-dependent DNA helicase RecG [Naasia sp. SYSU D00948]